MMSRCNRAVFHDLAGLSRLGRVFFLCGMPNDVGVELQQIMNIETVEMEHVISRARILVTNRLEPVIAASGIRHSGAAKEQSQKTHVGVSINNQAEFKGSNRKCFRCGGSHMIRLCPERAEKRVVVCYNCNEEGHIAPNCIKKNNQGND